MYAVNTAINLIELQKKKLQIFPLTIKSAYELNDNYCENQSSYSYLIKRLYFRMHNEWEFA